jgi:hypothetical protein
MPGTDRVSESLLAAQGTQFAFLPLIASGRVIFQTSWFMYLIDK